jgi:hypothetical protein
MKTDISKNDVYLCTKYIYFITYPNLIRFSTIILGTLNQGSQIIFLFSPDTIVAIKILVDFFCYRFEDDVMDIPDLGDCTRPGRVSTSHLIMELCLSVVNCPLHWCEKRIQLLSSACTPLYYPCSLFFGVCLLFHITFFKWNPVS